VLFEDNFNYLSKMCLLRMREAAFEMLRAAADRGAIPIVCGSDATDNAPRYLAAGARYVVVGEGEETLGDLLGRLAGGEPVGSGGDRGPSDERVGGIPGLIYIDRDGGLVDTGRRPPLRDLDALPFPAWDLVDVDRYRAAWARHGRFSMNMVSTRGCPFHCNWCAKPIWGQRYNTRSPENVVAELEWLRATYAPDHIAFADDILGLKPGWLERYAELVRERGVVTPFKCLERADLLLRPGEVEALAAAGCEMVWMGAESGSQRILDAMDKGTTVEQIVEAARLLRAAGIRVGFFLQFGYLGEVAADIEATRRLVRAALPDDIGVSVSYPLPGTPFHERVRTELGERQNWLDSADLAMLYHGPYSTRFYRRLHGLVHKEFRLWRAAGSDRPMRHVARAVRHPRSRAALGRLRDAVTLPIDRLVLAGLERLDRPAAAPPSGPPARA
jgi:anaerobic magnesium-protoporphyrin IX monomethyl ester cyclase